ncbi:hypothetical protein CIW52_06980 [Mycolicibacterium sp. P9-64]|uniref:hypothetical protein n=1 Tax=Mycolicibacterium sp. P9-64 TaxID=2024612 RepID=UPI0011EF2F5B|nr:hypothetical protein [Mycolicibacterium sp. P9-64]KAA0085626.1 hypothetical protein CIW52_06980 [Mycolicibacterium sp. P9-64]
MRRWIAVLWNTSFLVLAGVLYFFFVLPRWPELLGDTSHTLGTALRIVAGALIGLAALPVVFTLLRTRKPEFGTPRLALVLRVISIALLVLAGLLVIGTAISELWLSLDTAGQWLFGIYGAAAAITLLGLLAFHLAFTAELPPPPPKPLKPKTEKRRRGRGDAAEAPAESEVTDAVEDDADSEKDDAEAPVPAAADEPSESTGAVELTETTAADETTETNEVDEPANAAEADDDKADNDEETAGKLRNRRPSGKSLFKRSRGGVALED